MNVALSPEALAATRPAPRPLPPLKPLATVRRAPQPLLVWINVAAGHVRDILLRVRDLPAAERCHGLEDELLGQASRIVAEIRSAVACLAGADRPAERHIRISPSPPEERLGREISHANTMRNIAYDVHEAINANDWLTARQQLARCRVLVRSIAAPLGIATHPVERIVIEPEWLEWLGLGEIV